MNLSLEELLNFFEKNGQGSALVSDDAGHWAVTSEGFQNVPQKPPEDIETLFFIKADQWKPSIKEALQAFYDETTD